MHAVYLSLLVMSRSCRSKLIFTVLGKKATPINRTILSPRVHMLGDDAACICYVRLQQFINR